ncbi:MAG: DeoR/GlpR family DNA-binding transcription regulator [Arachnia sp.]
MTADRMDRESHILAQLADLGSLSVTSLASDLGVSEVTIRGDLKSLEQQGRLTRVRGGARPLTHQAILQRQLLNAEAKDRIAAAAAAMVLDDDTVMIEAGTTAAAIGRYLGSRRGVQVVTNSNLVFENARAHPSLTVIVSGGVFRRESESFVGPVAERAIGDFNTRIAFLGTDGFSIERGLTTRFVEGAQVAALMSQRAEETWLVADAAKFGSAGFVSFLPLSGITGLITDSTLPADAVAELSEHVEVRVV